MEFRLLGPLELIDGRGPAIELPAGKPRTLLALLLLEAGRVVSVDRIVDALWGERPPATAAKVVQGYVSRLRKLLPKDALTRSGPGYVLRVEDGQLDLDRFEGLRREGAAAVAAGRWEEGAALLEDALTLWRGAPLADFEYASFARDEIERLEELRLSVVEQRLEANLALGRAAEVVPELDALVREHPLHERFRGLQMLALYRSGRQAEALEAYHDAHAVLGEELGLEPSQALQALERAILVQDPALGLRRESLLSPALGGRVPLPGPLVPTPRFPFVGRSRELDSLRALLERAGEGEGALVLLGGEAGAGKTRLVREFAREAAAGGALVCYGSSDAAVSTPYQPLLEWLEFLLRVCEPAALGEGLAGGEALTGLMPELSRITGRSAAGVSDVDRFSLQRGVTELVSRLGSVQPLLLVADDIHWADGETLQLLRRLARTAPEARVLVLAAYRDRGEHHGTAFSDTLADLSRLDSVTRLPLVNLSTAEVGEFIHGATGAHAPEELASAIGDLTNGTPLLLCELWRDMMESGALELTTTVQLTRPLAELGGRERVSDVVRHRLARLGPETATLVELAAVAGPRFELRVLDAASELDHSTLLAALDEASEAGILEELPEPVPAYRFSHELVRRAVYDRIKRIPRARLHLRVGEALERTTGADAGRALPELAHHFTLAAPVDGVDRAVAYNLRVAEAAMTSGALAEAAASYSTALELGIADPRERARVEGELSYPLFETGQRAKAEALLEEAIETALGLGDRGLAVRLRVQLSLQQWRSSADWNAVEMERLARQAIETFQELGDRSGLAHAERLLGLALAGQGRIENLAAHERALAHADAAGDQVARRRNLASLGAGICGGPTPVPEGIGRLEELREAYRDDRVAVAVLTRFLSLLYAMAGRSEDALESARASSLVLDELQERTQSLNLQRFVAQALELAGDRAGAEREWTARWLRLRDLAGDAPDQDSVQAAAELAGFYCDEGRWEEAADLIAYGRDVEHRFHVAPHIARARLAAHRGEHAEALTLIERAVERTGRSDQPTAMRAHVEVALAEVQRAAGNTAEADAAVARALELYEQKGNLAAADRLRAGAANA